MADDNIPSKVLEYTKMLKESEILQLLRITKEVKESCKISDDNLFSKVLEYTKMLKESEMLQLLRITKEVKESSSKSFEKNFGANVYNKKGLCISFILTKIVVWNPKNNDNDKEYCKKPDDIYTMKISSKGFEKTVSKTEFELIRFIESLLSVYSVTHYDILMEDVVTVSEEIYEYLTDVKCNLRKLEEVNEEGDEYDEIVDMYMEEDSFYKHIASNITKVFSFAANL
jgi:hypothetical protein